MFGLLVRLVLLEVAKELPGTLIGTLIPQSYVTLAQRLDHTQQYSHIDAPGSGEGLYYKRALIGESWQRDDLRTSSDKSDRKQQPMKQGSPLVEESLRAIPDRSKRKDKKLKQMKSPTNLRYAQAIYRNKISKRNHKKNSKYIVKHNFQTKSNNRHRPRPTKRRYYVKKKDIHKMKKPNNGSRNRLSNTKLSRRTPIPASDCGMSYIVERSTRYSVRIKSNRNCGMIFRAGQGTSMSISCKSIYLAGECPQVSLFFSTGKFRDITHCKNITSTLTMDEEFQELLIYLRQQKEIRTKSTLKCSVTTKKNDGEYTTLGRQKCPLNCGQTTATAEAFASYKPKNDSPSIDDVSNSSTPSTLIDISSLRLSSNASHRKDSSQVDSDLNNGIYLRPLANISNSKSDFRPSFNHGQGELDFPFQKHDEFINRKVSSKQNSFRIKGGKASSQGEWPWMVNLNIQNAKGVYICGGTLITFNHVLTAAHCIHDIRLNNIENRVKVIAGTHILGNTGDFKKQTSIVKQIFIHPKFNYPSLDADIAILKLKRSFKLTETVKTVCLAPKEKYKDMEAVLVGWGIRGENKVDTDVMHEVTVNITSNKRCDRIYSKNNQSSIVTRKHICNFTPGKDSCLGDSGGPMLIRMGTSWYQVGIISFGYSDKCDIEGFPGVNTYVPAYLDWILKTVQSTKCE